MEKPNNNKDLVGKNRYEFDRDKKTYNELLQSDSTSHTLFKIFIKENPQIPGKENINTCEYQKEINIFILSV